MICIYSAKCAINSDTDTDVVKTYYALINQKFKSNQISNKILTSFTEKDLSDMQYVDQKIADTLKANWTSDTLYEAPPECKQNASDQVNQYEAMDQKRYNDLVSTLDSLVKERYVANYSYC